MESGWTTSLSHLRRNRDPASDAPSKRRGRDKRMGAAFVKGLFSRALHHRGRDVVPELATVIKLEEWLRRKE